MVLDGFSAVGRRAGGVGRRGLLLAVGGVVLEAGKDMPVLEGVGAEDHEGGDERGEGEDEGEDDGVDDDLSEALEEGHGGAEEDEVGHERGDGASEYGYAELEEGEARLVDAAVRVGEGEGLEDVDGCVDGDAGEEREKDALDPSEVVSGDDEERDDAEDDGAEVEGGDDGEDPVAGDEEDAGDGDGEVGGDGHVGGGDHDGGGEGGGDHANLCDEH